MTWLKANEVAEYLQYSDKQRAIHLNIKNENDKKCYSELNLPFDHIKPGNMQPATLFINEPGVYALLRNSNKELAVRFQTWLDHDVVPSIRKTGKYELNSNQITTLNEIKTDLLTAVDEIKIDVNKNHGELKVSLYEVKTDLDVIRHDQIELYQNHENLSTEMKTLKRKNLETDEKLENLEKKQKLEIKELQNDIIDTKKTITSNTVKHPEQQHLISVIAMTWKMEDFIENAYNTFKIVAGRQDHVDREIKKFNGKLLLKKIVPNGIYTRRDFGQYMRQEFGARKNVKITVSQVSEHITRGVRVTIHEEYMIEQMERIINATANISPTAK